jgi:predicted naringenin-chalcone synthase
MDDLGAQVSDFLSQPGAMEQIEALAKQLGLGPSETPKSPEEAAENSLISPENLHGLLSALEEASKPDRSTGVLEALRPLLQPERQGKIDRAIRAIRLIRAAKTASATLEL